MRYWWDKNLSLINFLRKFLELEPLKYFFQLNIFPHEEFLAPNFYIKLRFFSFYDIFQNFILVPQHLIILAHFTRFWIFFFITLNDIVYEIKIMNVWCFWKLKSINHFKRFFFFLKKRTKWIHLSSCFISRSRTYCILIFSK